MSKAEALTAEASILPMPAALFDAGSKAIFPAVTPSPVPAGPLSTSNVADVPALSTKVIVVASFGLSVKVMVAVAAVVEVLIHSSTKSVTSTSRSSDPVTKLAVDQTAESALPEM